MARRVTARILRRFWQRAPARRSVTPTCWSLFIVSAEREISAPPISSCSAIGRLRSIRDDAAHRAHLLRFFVVPAQDYLHLSVLAEGLEEFPWVDPLPVCTWQASALLFGSDGVSQQDPVDGHIWLGTFR